jgi:hypothetical protein
MKKTKKNNHNRKKNNHNKTNKNININVLNNPLSYYVNYIVSLKKSLLKNLFTTQLPKITQPQLELEPEEVFENAYQYYQKYHKQRPSIYIISSKTKTNICYSAKNNNSIAEGTFMLQKSSPEIVNLYQVKTNYGIETYRFGTPVYTFKHIQSILSNIHTFHSKKKKLINISLLSPCNTNACRSLAVIAKPFANNVNLLKKGLSATKEDNIIIKELNANNKIFNNYTYYTILFPLSSQTYTGVGSKYLITSLSTYKYNKDELKEMIHNDKVKKIYDYINLENDSNGEKIFKSIVQIAMYYYLELKDEYILSYHCKSGKDRTSTFDSIIQSTFYYLYLEYNKENRENEYFISNISSDIYNKIRNYSKHFLLYGLMIAFYSTGIVGLKLKNIPVAKYIFHDDKRLFERFIGHSSMVSS